MCALPTAPSAKPKPDVVLFSSIILLNFYVDMPVIYKDRRCIPVLVWQRSFF
uniref:Uncharacterized protein n=1 Tax=Zea mays TaxID=4577 RepID=B4FLG5_MAIZE|nr:unknown [Zea mays]